jgi:hypothetical protein
MSNLAELHPKPQPVVCSCGRTVFDGEVIKSRAVKLFPVPVALCRCKAWVRVPIAYT